MEIQLSQFFSLFNSIMDINNVLVLGAGAVLFLYGLYRYLTRDFDYWAKQNVPFIKPRVLIGSIDLTKPLHELEEENYKKYGRVYGMFEGSRPTLTVADPEFLKDILIKDFHVFPNHRDLKSNDPTMDNSLFALENKDWKRVRSTVSPIFTSAKLRKMMTHLEECSDMVIEKFEAIIENGETIICQNYFGKYTMGAIGRCAFGIRIKDEDEDIIVEKAKGTLSCFLSWRTIAIVLFPKIVKWLRISILNPNTISYFQKLMEDVVKQSKASEKKGRADFLQRLLDAEDRYSDRNNNGQNCPSGAKNDPPANHHLHTIGLTPDESIAQCINFFMAGFDATTSLMSHTIHQLAVHSCYQERLHQEIENVLAQNDNKWNYDALYQMKFLDAMMCEALRLCPSLVRIDRRAEQEYELGASGIKLRKGMLVNIPLYAMQRDPEWYPDPEVYKPERFLSEDLEPPPYTYLPFGGGPRICIGKRFVEMSAKMLLAKLVHKFKIELANPEKIALNIIEMRAILKVSEVEVRLIPRF